MGRQILSAPLGLAVAACATLLGGCTAEPGSPDGLPRWSVTRELRIGSIDDPAHMLTAVGDLAVGSDGRIYVAQPDDATIRVFNGSGTLVDYIGQRGQEPGGFERLYSIGFLADTLYAIDLGLRRITRFSPDGDVLRSDQVNPPPASPPFFPGMPFALFPDGSMAIGTAFPASITPEDLRRVPQLRLDATGQLLDTVTWISYERSARRAAFEGRPLSVGSPLSDDAFAVFSDDGTRIANIDRTVATGPGPASFGIALTDGWGDTIYDRRYEYTPNTIEPATIDSVIVQRASSLVGAFEEPRQAAGFVRGTMFLPVYYTPVSAASFSEAGELWVRREDVAGQMQRWMVLDEAGEQIAEVRVPMNVQVMHIGTDAFWGLEPDELGAPYIVRYRIDR